MTAQAHRHADLMRQGFMKTSDLKPSKAKNLDDAAWGRALAEAARERWAEQGFD